MKYNSSVVFFKQEVKIDQKWVPGKSRKLIKKHEKMYKKWPKIGEEKLRVVEGKSQICDVQMIPH